MTQKQKAVTEHGEVEYEVVECASCENKIAKEEAMRFVVGDYKGTKHWSHKADELEFHDYDMGYACEYCRENPVGFPRPTFNVDDETLIMIAGMLCVVAVLSMGAFL